MRLRVQIGNNWVITDLSTAYEQAECLAQSTLDGGELYSRFLAVKDMLEAVRLVYSAHGVTYEVC